MPPRNQPTARQERLGAELRKMREAAGMTAREAAGLLGTNPIQMSQVESGKAGISEERLRRLASHYACSDDQLIDALVAMATEKHKGWWEDYRAVLSQGALDLAELEHHSRYMRTFQSAYVPGLLQTEDYMKAIFSYTVPRRPQQYLDSLVAHRLRRQSVLEHVQPPGYEAVVHEATLRTRVADRGVARGQLEAILERMRYPHVTVRVVSLDTDGFGGAGYSMFYASGPVDSLDTVEIDTMHGARWMDARSQLIRYRAIFEKIKESALSISDSERLMHRMVREM